MTDRNGLERLLFGLDFSKLYPGIFTKDRILELFTNDLTLLCDELGRLDGITGAGGEVYMQKDHEGKWRVFGELKIIESHFSDEALDAKFELMAEGFMYKPHTNTWIAAGVL